MQFVLCIERFAEKNNSKANQGIAFAPKHRGAFFSLALRGPEIFDKIDQDAGNLQIFADCCSEVRQLGPMVRRLNLLGCAALNVTLIEKGGKLSINNHTPIVRSLVYRCDANSQYTDMSQHKRIREVAQKKMRQVIKALL